MLHRTYAYLRASTNEQDVMRSQKDLKEFAELQGCSIASWFCENESGAKLARPELFRLLDMVATISCKGYEDRRHRL